MADERGRLSDDLETTSSQADEAIEMPEGHEPRGLFEIVAAIYATYGGWHALELAPQSGSVHNTEWSLAVFIASLAVLFAVGIVLRARWAMSVGILMATVAMATGAIYFMRGDTGALPSLIWSGLLLLWMVEPVLHRALEGDIGKIDMPWWAARHGNRLGRNFGLEVKISLGAAFTLLGIVIVFTLMILNGR